MAFPNLKVLARRPPIVIAALVTIAILSFAGVNHLVVRFREQQKALARRMFRRGLEEVAAGMPERAVENFRVALAYDRGNDQYQLSLARALRDTGRREEARTYLLNLWERRPEDSTINLALARLAVRESSLPDALRYYHNAMYGVWPSDGDSKRHAAQFELLDFLLRDNALPQAQAELITMTPASPFDPGFHLRLGTLFVRAQDYEHALAQFEQVLRINHEDAVALAGAGDAAFHLGRYRSAEGFLSAAAKANPHDPESRQLLRQTTLVLEADPYIRRISNAERERRVRQAFAQSGKRIDSCMAAKQIPPNSTAADLPSLKSQWVGLKPRLAHLRSNDTELHDAVMDLVFRIEQSTATQCGPPSDLDEVLLVLAQDRNGVER